jgi:hypothetical protein
MNCVLEKVGLVGVEPSLCRHKRMFRKTLSGEFQPGSRVSSPPRTQKLSTEHIKNAARKRKSNPMPKITCACTIEKEKIAIIASFGMFY